MIFFPGTTMHSHPQPVQRFALFYPAGRVQERIVAYSNKVGHDGVYLEVLDAMLYASKQGAALEVIVPYLDEPLTAIRSEKIAKEYVGLEPDFNLPENAETWYLLGTSASFDLSPAAIRNHYIPCFAKSKLSDDLWDKLTEETLREGRRTLFAMRHESLRLGEDESLDPMVRDCQVMSMDCDIKSLLIVCIAL